MTGPFYFRWAARSATGTVLSLCTDPDVWLQTAWDDASSVVLSALRPSGQDEVRDWNPPSVEDCL